MKVKFIFAFVLLTATCIFTSFSNNKRRQPVGSEWIDPEFAKILQQKGYIADAANVTPAEVANKIALYVESQKLTSLRGIEYFVSLKVLCCDNNRLTQLDVSRNTKLTEFYCANNQLTQLDVDKNTQLRSLICSGNHLQQLDISNNQLLTELDCSNNQLTQIDVSNNKQLAWFDCSSNHLTQLDVDKNTQLRELGCTGNHLKQLDVNNIPRLRMLVCYDNPGVNGLFRVKALFDNSNIPSSITAYKYYQSIWDYDGRTVRIDYYK